MKKYFLLLMACLMFVLPACNKTGPSENKAESTYPPMVKVKGTIYVDTGYENAMVKCGTADGQIKTTVDGRKMPDKDDESNFGKGYGYQTWEKGYINVQIDNRWILFRDLDLKDESREIPQWVAHFTGRVIKAEEDSLMVEATDINDRFYFKEIMTKPISLSIENLDNSKDGKVTTEGLDGKTVEVYFGGEIKNIEPENSVPIFLENIYRIIVK